MGELSIEMVLGLFGFVDIDVLCCFGMSMDMMVLHRHVNLLC
jgi:hypothetical protein